MTPIPISDAQRIAEDYGYHQVVIIARAVGEGGGEHVTTYGAGREHCAVAAHIGQYLRTEIMSWSVEPHESVTSEIARERERQIEAEGWTREHDGQHTKHEIAKAAACYAYAAALPDDMREILLSLTPADVMHRWRELPTIGRMWPWNWEWWKPKSRRRDLVRAAALIVAEIERLDRIAQRSEARP